MALVNSVGKTILLILEMAVAGSVAQEFKAQIFFLPGVQVGEASAMIHKPLRAIVIDASGDVKKFEAGLAEDVLLAIRGHNIETPQGPAVQVSNVTEFRSVLERSDWNLAVVVAHGGPAGEEDAAQMNIAKERYNWYEALADIDLEGRGLVLAICCGDNVDVEFLAKKSRAAWFIGSGKKIGPDQVRTYLEAFLEKLAPHAPNNVERETVKTIHDSLGQNTFNFGAA